MNEMDVALAVEHLLGEADYRSAASYAALTQTWRDARPLPTLAELQAAWAALKAARLAEEDAIAQRESVREALDAQMRTLDLSAPRTAEEIAAAVNWLLARSL